MKKTKDIIFWILLALLAMSCINLGLADAHIYKASYTEPTTNSDGSLLLDLDHCTLYYQVPGGVATKAWDKAATAPIGGGNVSDEPVTVTVPVVEEYLVDFWMTCSDVRGGTSEPCPKIKPLDTLFPSFPIHLIISR